MAPRSFCDCRAERSVALEIDATPDLKGAPIAIAIVALAAALEASIGFGLATVAAPLLVRAPWSTVR